MAVFLILSIAFNTVFAVSYKVAAQKKCNLEMVNIWMYAGSLVTIAAYVLLKRHLEFNTPALYLGIAAGITAYFTTLAFFYHIKHGQLSASWTVISLSVAFPVLASIFIWHERPSIKQLIGLVLIVVALLLFGRHETSKSEGAKR